MSYVWFSKKTESFLDWSTGRVYFCSFACAEPAAWTGQSIYYCRLSQREANSVPAGSLEKLTKLLQVAEQAGHFKELEQSGVGVGVIE